MSNDPQLQQLMRNPATASSRIYIGNLLDHVTSQDISAYFCNYGNIKGVLLNRGFGFIQFDNDQSATNAIQNENGKMFNNRKMVVRTAMKNADKNAKKMQQQQGVQGGSAIGGAGDQQQIDSQPQVGQDLNRTAQPAWNRRGGRGRNNNQQQKQGNNSNKNNNSQQFGGAGGGSGMNQGFGMGNQQQQKQNQQQQQHNNPFARNNENNNFNNQQGGSGGNYSNKNMLNQGQNNMQNQGQGQNIMQNQGMMNQSGANMLNQNTFNQDSNNMYNQDFDGNNQFDTDSAMYNQDGEMSNHSGSMSSSHGKLNQIDGNNMIASSGGIMSSGSGGGGGNGGNMPIMNQQNLSASSTSINQQQGNFVGNQMANNMIGPNTNQQDLIGDQDMRSSTSVGDNFGKTIAIEDCSSKPLNKSLVSPGPALNETTMQQQSSQQPPPPPQQHQNQQQQQNQPQIQHQHQQPPQQQHQQLHQQPQHQQQWNQQNSNDNNQFNQNYQNNKRPFMQHRQPPMSYIPPPKQTRYFDRNDCEIIVVTRDLTAYAEAIEDRLKRCGLIVDLLFPNEDVPIGKVLANIVSRGCLFAILVTHEHEQHRSVTVNVLFGQQQSEHRNMPVDDAIEFIQAKFNDKMRRQTLPQLPKAVDITPTLSYAVPPLSARHPDTIQKLIDLLSENRAITVLQYDRVIKYLQDRRQLQLKAEIGDAPVNITIPPPIDPEAELQRKIMDILNKPSITNTIVSTVTATAAAIPAATITSSKIETSRIISPATSSAAITKITPATSTSSSGSSSQPQLLNDPKVQKALDSLLSGNLFNF